MQLYTTMTSLWCNFSDNVVANSKWSCLLISAPKVHWRVQPLLPDVAADSTSMHGDLRALHVSQQRVYANCPQIIEKEKNIILCSKEQYGHIITLQIRMPWRYRVWGATHETILKPSSEAKNSFWIKSRAGEDMGQFSACPINKTVPSFRNSLTRVCEQW